MLSNRATTTLTSPSRSEITCNVSSKVVVDPVRRKIMQSVGRTNTHPEIIVRRLVHALGYRFRLHRRGLPGTPDIVLPRHHAVIFVHGCFWHRHKGCPKASMPKSRIDYWSQKFASNVRRDEKAISELTEMGWRVLVVWECEIKTVDTLSERMKVFLEEDHQD